jgi:hypothetical protein
MPDTVDAIELAVAVRQRWLSIYIIVVPFNRELRSTGGTSPVFFKASGRASNAC